MIIDRDLNAAKNILIKVIFIRATAEHAGSQVSGDNYSKVLSLKEEAYTF